MKDDLKSLVINKIFLMKNIRDESELENLITDLIFEAVPGVDFVIMNERFRIDLAAWSNSVLAL